MKYPELFLMRHGQTEWNVARRLQGWLDSPLTEQGRAHARAQGRILAGMSLPDPLDIRCSPLGRTRETARLALAEIGRTPEFDEDLREVMGGDWQGRLWSDVGVEHPALFYQHDHNITALSLVAPGGETEDQLRDRCLRVLGKLTRPTLLISHGVTLCVLRAILGGLTHQQMVNLPITQGTVQHFRDGKETTLKEA